MLWSRNCDDYEQLNASYSTNISSNSRTISIPLIDVYNLTKETKLTDDGRTIF